MLLPEEDHAETINSFSELQWQQLMDLMPLIEQTQKFGKMGGGEKIKEGVFTIPHWNEDGLVSKFREIVYDMPIIINFDWGHWDEGREIAGNENFDYDTIDIPTKCKLITAIVRNDRFCEGALISAFESGLILKILKSIKNQIG